MTSYNRVGSQYTSPATELFRLAATVATVIPRQALLAIVVATAITHSLEAVELGVDGARFTLDGKPTFLLGISYYGALGAPEPFIAQDLDDMQRHGFNWIRVWATWSFFDNDVSAVDEAGEPREPFMSKLQGLVAECDRRGMVVDVTLARSNGKSGAGRLATSVAHRRSVETLVTMFPSGRYCQNARTPCPA